LLLAANKVMSALGVDALSSLPVRAQPMTWKRRATRVVLELDSECFWFELAPT